MRFIFTLTGILQLDRDLNHSYQYHVLFLLFPGVYDTTTIQHERRRTHVWHYEDQHLFHYTCGAYDDLAPIHKYGSIIKISVLKLNYIKITSYNMV